MKKFIIEEDAIRMYSIWHPIPSEYILLMPKEMHLMTTTGL